MNPEVVEKLTSLNRQFYQDFARHFSDTRLRLQPGIRTIIERLPGNLCALDLGCGNGSLACALVSSLRSGYYLGMDFSDTLLEIARDRVAAVGSGESLLTTKWLQADLTGRDWPQAVSALPYSEIFAFAVLHHIPGADTRLELLHSLRRLIQDGGHLYLSNWQFLNSERLRGRILPWEMISLEDGQLDPGDYLLDWRRGGLGLRYAHHYSQRELDLLAEKSGFRVVDVFLSDGKQGNLGLYNIWSAN
jgi:SAM-dependent methyltransferase